MEHLHLTIIPLIQGIPGGNLYKTLLDYILSFKVHSFKYKINAGCKNIRITVFHFTTVKP